MGERKSEVEAEDSGAELFEPAIGDLMDEEFEELELAKPRASSLAEKRGRAEERLEEKRMRDELGYYDMEFDDF